MITWLRTILFFVVWVALTLVMGILFLPVLFSQHATWKIASLWATLTLLWLRIACGIRSEVRGIEHLPAHGGLIAAKHQSAWDTLMLWKVLRNPAFVLKRELYRIPVFGWYLLRCGHIGIDRTAGRSALRHIENGAQHVVAQGRSIVIFPEGTRMRPGEQKQFHAGVARLSQALRLPVIPAALNAGKFWPKWTLRKFPGTAILEFLPPEPGFKDAMSPWLTHLQMVVNTKTAQLEKEVA